MPSDPLGQAIADYFTASNKQKSSIENIRVISSDFDDDEIKTAYLFRDFAQMVPLEQRALQLCKGYVLDIGSGAGAHGLYLQQQGHKVLSIDQSQLAIHTQLRRGIKQALCIDIHQFNPGLRNEKFDTILALMNGIGIVGSLEGLIPFLIKLKQWLKPGGQLLLDSSDLLYLFDEPHLVTTPQEVALSSSYLSTLSSSAPITPKHTTIDGLDRIPNRYYGEIDFQLAYRHILGTPFSWLYIDYPKLAQVATLCGWQCEQIAADNHFSYLAKLSLEATTNHPSNHLAN